MSKAKHIQSAEYKHELDEYVLGYLAEGLWSGFGVAAQVQPQPVASYNGHLFYLFAPQQWVMTFFEDSVLDTLCETKL